MKQFIRKTILYDIETGDIDVVKEQGTQERIKFILDGCDISFVAEAPKDMTLGQLLKQADKIHPDWCACGIRSFGSRKWDVGDTEVIFDYDNVRKANDDVSCEIWEE